MRADIAGSTAAHVAEPASNPEVSSTVAAPRPAQRTCIRAPSTPTSSSSSVVGRSSVPAVVVGVSDAVVVGGASGLVGFGKTVDVVDGTAVVGAVDLRSVALLVGPLPQAAARRASTIRAAVRCIP